MTKEQAIADAVEWLALASMMIGDHDTSTAEHYEWQAVRLEAKAALFELGIRLQNVDSAHQQLGMAASMKKIADTKRQQRAA